MLQTDLVLNNSVPVPAHISFNDGNSSSQGQDDKGHSHRIQFSIISECDKSTLKKIFIFLISFMLAMPAITSSVSYVIEYQHLI